MINRPGLPHVVLVWRSSARGAHLHSFIFNVANHTTHVHSNRTSVRTHHSRTLHTQALVQPATYTMSAQSNDQQMEGVQDTKGKGKAPQEVMEESEDSSDESAGEDQVRELYLLLAPMQIANQLATGCRTYAPHPSRRD